MAAVLDAMVPYVKNLIAGMAEEEVNMLLGVSGEITKLEDNTESIKAFLADAERRRITEQSIQRWVNKLKDAMYDATDILDLCQLEANKRRESEDGCIDEKAPSCCQSLLFCLRNPMFAHKIGSRIKELNQRLEDIRKVADQFNFNINLVSYQDRRMTSHTEHSSRKAISEFDESTIVGKNVESDMKLLIQELITDDNSNIKVVSISGMGGIGKTTLTQKIFKETTIQEHFKTKIWLSISKNFDDAELLRSAIKHAGRDPGEERDMSLLVRTLTDALSASKFLVVMDDIWSDEAWSNVLCVPIRNASRNIPGSRVLVTTRLNDLAPKMGESFHQHYVSPLDKEDAWFLLKKQLAPNQVVGIEQLKNIGMDILKKCDGLPLAIKVIGGLLSTRYPSELEWKAVLESPAWSVGGLPKQLDNLLYLSYEDLSPQLKQCFLYCSLFPKGTKIIQQVITPMWISEGFIQPLGASSSLHDGYGGLEDIAIQYYRELINRNLIEPIVENSLTQHECTMHDVVRSFAEHMTRDESLVVVDDKQASTTLRDGSSSMLVRRLSLGRTVSVADWAVLQRQKSLRTLMISCRVNLKSGDSLGSFSSLRVLYIWSANNLDRLVDSLSKLKHLRYLYLKDTDVSRLPEDIHKMKFLLHMHLPYCKKLGHLPNSITKLVHLRSLALKGTNISVVPKGFGGLSNLRLLHGFPVHVDDMDAGSSSSSSNSWCSLQELAPLSQLRDLTLDGLEKVPACWMAEKAMIRSKAHLTNLELNYNNHSASKHITTEPCGDEEANEKQKLQQEVLEKLCPPTWIENLGVLGGYVGFHLPNWMCAPASAEFKSLRFLTLEDLPCCTHLPDGLRCLPSLELLLVENAPSVKQIGPEFQASLAPSTSAAHPPFPKLRELLLNGLCEWEEWDWNHDGCEEEGDAKAVIAMPYLESLCIQNCKLRCLPPGLANNKRYALRELYLYEITNLASVENFPSVVELDVFDCPELKRISSLFMLHKIRIVRCPNVEVLEGVPALDSLVLEDATMETLPGFLQVVNLKYLEVDCSMELYESLSTPGSSEWNKISHIGKHNIILSEDSDGSSLDIN